MEIKLTDNIILVFNVQHNDLCLCCKMITTISYHPSPHVNTE